MKSVRNLAGYVLGGVLFVGLLPTIMWLVPPAYQKTI